jgi:hypothetical protein
MPITSMRAHRVRHPCDTVIRIFDTGAETPLTG